MKTYLTLLFAGFCFSSFSEGSRPAGYTHISDADLARGYTVQAIGTNETFDFTAPVTAGYATNWYLRGAATDYFRFILDRWPFPMRDQDIRDLVFVANGDVRITENDWLPNHLVSLGVVPAYAWSSLPESCTAICPPLGLTVPQKLSLFWWSVGIDSVRLTWQNALLERSAENPVSYQVEFFRNGNFTFRLDLSRVSTTNAVFGRLEETYGLSNVTSVLYHRLAPDDSATNDRDGDGVNTDDEIFRYGTNPGRSDSDYDGLSDGLEISRGLSPLEADTDGDGYGDATDPDPLVPTSWTDTDGDGMPDAWKNTWFGAIPVSATEDANADGISNGLSPWLGVHPTNPPPSKFALSSKGFPVNMRGWEVVPVAFACTNRTAGETLVSRSFRVGRTSPWQQYFLTSDTERPAGWAASDIDIVWSNALESGSVPTNGWDSFRLPLATNDFKSVLTISLTATGPRPFLDRPLYLVSWIPHLEYGTTEDTFVSNYGRCRIMARNNKTTNLWSVPFTRSDDGYPHWGGIDEDVARVLAQSPVTGLMMVGSSFTTTEPYSFDMPAEGTMPSTQIIFYEVDWSPWSPVSSFMKTIKGFFTW